MATHPAQVCPAASASRTPSPPSRNCSAYRAASARHRPRMPSRSPASQRSIEAISSARPCRDSSASKSISWSRDISSAFSGTTRMRCAPEPGRGITSLVIRALERGGVPSSTLNPSRVARERCSPLCTSRANSSSVFCAPAQSRVGATSSAQYSASLALFSLIRSAFSVSPLPLIDVAGLRRSHSSPQWCIASEASDVL